MRSTLALLSMAVLAVPATAASGAPISRDVPPSAGSKGMTIVAQIPGAGGTDLELFSRTLPRYRDAKGRMVAKRSLRHFAIVGNLSNDARIVDVTNPEKPFVAATIPCALNQGDIQVNAARSLVIIANDAGTSERCRYLDRTSGSLKPMPPGAAVVDIRDVYQPRVIGAAPTPTGAHNVTLAPGGRYLYISTSAIVQAASGVPIFDLVDPTRPKQVGLFSAPGNSPHDIRFNAKGTRAYLAGVSTYRILDTTNLEAPKLISTFYPPGTSIGHDVVVSPDGAFLFAGDEGGGGTPYPCPGGAVHTFDIRIEAAPVYLGQSFAGAGPVTNRDVQTPEAGTVGSCTSHVMDLNPDGKSFTLGWYEAGSRVFSFASLYKEGTPTPVPAAAYGSNGIGLVETSWIRPTGGSTWSAKQYAPLPGYIFSDDLDLGFYVTRLPKAK